jgi:hypothetical protein
MSPTSQEQFAYPPPQSLEDVFGIGLRGTMKTLRKSGEMMEGVLGNSNVQSVLDGYDQVTKMNPALNWEDDVLKLGLKTATLAPVAIFKLVEKFPWLMKHFEKNVDMDKALKVFGDAVEARAKGGVYTDDLFTQGGDLDTVLGKALDYMEGHPQVGATDVWTKLLPAKSPEQAARVMGQAIDPTATRKVKGGYELVTPSEEMAREVERTKAAEQVGDIARQVKDPYTQSYISNLKGLTTYNAARASRVKDISRDDLSRALGASHSTVDAMAEEGFLGDRIKDAIRYTPEKITRNQKDYLIRRAKGVDIRAAIQESGLPPEEMDLLTKWLLQGWKPGHFKQRGLEFDPSKVSDQMIGIIQSAVEKTSSSPRMGTRPKFARGKAKP